MALACRQDARIALQVAFLISATVPKPWSSRFFPNDRKSLRTPGYRLRNRYRRSTVLPPSISWPFLSTICGIGPRVVPLQRGEACTHSSRRASGMDSRYRSRFGDPELPSLRRVLQLLKWDGLRDDCDAQPANTVHIGKSCPSWKAITRDPKPHSRPRNNRRRLERKQYRRSQQKPAVHSRHRTLLLLPTPNTLSEA